MFLWWHASWRKALGIYGIMMLSTLHTALQPQPAAWAGRDQSVLPCSLTQTDLRYLAMYTDRSRSMMDTTLFPKPNRSPSATVNHRSPSRKRWPTPCYSCLALISLQHSIHVSLLLWYGLMILSTLHTALQPQPAAWAGRDQAVPPLLFDPDRPQISSNIHR